MLNKIFTKTAFQFSLDSSQICMIFNFYIVLNMTAKNL